MIAMMTLPTSIIAPTVAQKWIWRMSTMNKDEFISLIGKNIAYYCDELKLLLELEQKLEKLWEAKQ